MRNIALIINTLQGGGAERCAADLSLIFTRKGYHVYIFTDLSVKAAYENHRKRIRRDMERIC